MVTNSYYLDKHFSGVAMSFFSNPFFETGQEPVPITEIECSSKKLEKDANANPKYIFPIVTIQTKVNNIYF